MEPLTILSLAGAIVQFIDFSSKLVSNSVNIYRFTAGATDENISIENVYEKLNGFSDDLQALYDHKPPDGTTPGHALELRQIRALASDCKDSCQEMLKLMHRLKPQGQAKSSWASFRAAIKASLKSEEIAKLDEKIQRIQASLTLRICSLSTNFHKDYLRIYRQLKVSAREHDLRQEKQLYQIYQVLEEIKVHIRRREDRPFQPSEITDLERQLDTLTITSFMLEKQQSIIQSLRFETLESRRMSIPEAHTETFNWAFSDAYDKEQPQSSLLRWLRGGDGLFWVSGKPGSGKSTFMKLAASHPKTRVALESWSGRHDIIIAGHYFWIFGTGMQKSQIGLLQSLLFDIFRQCPELIETACPKRWIKQEASGLEEDDWSLQELRVVFESITSQHSLSQKFCFFIDGLDEYEGEHLEFCHQLLNLAKSNNVKLCVSSRPWNTFNDSFLDCPQLRIHDLTRNDIANYSRDRLESHPRWQRLLLRKPDTSSIITDVVDKSHGVFLWVFLVTRMLREGLTNGDSHSDLNRRLASVPSDLESFFKHMLDTVEPFYHEKMAGALLLALRAPSPLRLLVYSFHDQEYDDIDYAMSMQTKIFPPAAQKFMADEAARRINGHCRGLLEAHDGRLQFLHRTVADFLRGHQVFVSLQEKASPQFDAAASTLRAYLACIKSTGGRIPPNWIQNQIDKDDSEIYELVYKALTTASDMENEQHAAATSANTHFDILDEIEETLCNPDADTFKHDEEMVLSYSASAQAFFRTLVIQADVSQYLRHKLEEDSDYNEFGDSTPMYLALRHKPPSRAASLKADSGRMKKTLNVLFDYGQSFNDSYVDDNARGTHWMQLLSAIFQDLDFFKLSGQLEDYLQSGFFEFVLDSGVNANAMVACAPGNLNVEYRQAWLAIVSIAFFCDIQHHKIKAAYLNVLDAFLSHGADLDIDRQTFDAGTFTRDPTRWTLEIVRWMQQLKLGQCPLYFDIVKRLVVRSRESGLELDDHWDDLHEVVGESKVTQLKALYSNKRVDGERSARMAKRRSSFTDTSRPPKHPKT